MMFDERSKSNSIMSLVGQNSMKIKNNHTNLDTVLGVQSIDDTAAEKCIGGSFVVDLGSVNIGGFTRNLPGYAVTGNSARIFVGFDYEGLTLSNNDNDSFAIEWMDANNNVFSTVSANSFNSSDIPESAVYAQVTEN